MDVRTERLHSSQDGLTGLESCEGVSNALSGSYPGRSLKNKAHRSSCIQRLRPCHIWLCGQSVGQRLISFLSTHDHFFLSYMAHWPTGGCHGGSILLKKGHARQDSNAVSIGATLCFPISVWEVLTFMYQSLKLHRKCQWRVCRACAHPISHRYTRYWSHYWATPDIPQHNLYSYE